MSDPLRTDAARPADGPTEAGKEARIEQLLLAGLDQYFAGQYEQAINIWTRVVFLERGHNRARAYIERARGALAERHRESDELLHRGIAAFNDGENDEARDLITRAVEQGGSQDVALVLLERLNRLASPSASPDLFDAIPVRAERVRPVDVAIAPRKPNPWWMRAAAAAAAIMGGLAVAVVSGMPVPDWLADPIGTPQEQVAAMPPDPLPIARSSERLVARARELQAGGQLHDAIRTLEMIGLADPLRHEADRLRGDLQRQLLEAAR
jgi:tetratricopeptide (TPR) repeat protein